MTFRYLSENHSDYVFMCIYFISCWCAMMISVWSAVFAWIWVKSERQRSCQEDLNLIPLTLYKVCTSLAWDHDREREPFSSIFIIVKYKKSALLKLRMIATDCKGRTRSSLQDAQSRLNSYEVHAVSRNNFQIEFSWIPSCSLEKSMKWPRNRRVWIKLLTCKM